MYPLAFLGALGPWEVIVIALVALLLFGKRLPEFARSAGKAISTFKQGLSEVESDLENAGKPDPSESAEDASSKPGDKPTG